MNCVVVLTWKDLETFFSEGGVGKWVANEDRVLKCTYVVAVANANARRSEHPQVRHQHAFFIGKVSGTKPAPDEPRRLIIQVSEYATVDVPEAWHREQNPVRYADLAEFGIDPATLEWVPFPTDREEIHDPIPPLTIEEAKRGISKKLGVSPEQIEIIIRARVASTPLGSESVTGFAAARTPATTKPFIPAVISMMYFRVAQMLGIRAAQ